MNFIKKRAEQQQVKLHYIFLHAAGHELVSRYAYEGFMLGITLRTELGWSDQKIQSFETAVHDYDKTLIHSDCDLMVLPLYPEDCAK